MESTTIRNAKEQGRLGLALLLNRDSPIKRQIRTSFDERTSSDLLHVVTRTGIEPMLPP